MPGAIPVMIVNESSEGRQVGPGAADLKFLQSGTRSLAPRESRWNRFSRKLGILAMAHRQGLLGCRLFD
jgi:hypothetical protein